MFFKKSKKAIFLIHGFTDSVQDNFSYFIKEVEKRTTIDCVAFDLHGHGHNGEIEDFDYKQCISEVEKNYQDTLAAYDKVYLLGFSMGGVIAGHLASQYGCDKLILLAPAFKYIENSGLASNLFDLITEDLKNKNILNLFNFNDKTSLEHFISDKYKNEKVVFSKYLKGNISTSIKPYINFVMLVDKLDSNYLITKTPTRIYIGECDELVPVKAATYVYNRVTSKDKMLKVLPHVYHELLESSLKKELTKEIIRFIR